MDTSDEMVNTKEKAVIRYETNVESEENEKFLILFPNAVVDPWAVVVHFLDTPLTDRTVMSPLRFDATALRALKYHLALLKSHPLNVFLCSISSGHSSWVCEHGSQMRADCKKGEGLKDEAIDDTEHFVRVGIKDDTYNHKFCIEYQEPCEEDTKEAAYILDAPKTSVETSVLIVNIKRNRSWVPSTVTICI